MSIKRVAVLISGRGSNMSALVEAAAAEGYPAEIRLVISNRPDAAGLDHARAAGIAGTVIDHTTYGTDRQAFEQALDARLRDAGVDLICLAGFMRLLTPWFVSRWHGQMLNIHPSLLPAFKGLDTHERALAAGVKIHGATVHFVVPEMDAGPIVVQGAVGVRGDDTAASLGARVLAVEHQIYPLALRVVAEGRVSIEDGMCRIVEAAAPDATLIVPQVD
jgi:phosphoribosylglycinamide formyltransferase-1